MEIDSDRIDEAVLALLYLGLHDRSRAWKGFDWDALDRLHKKGFISDPVSKAKSVTFTEDGLREAERLFRELFAARLTPPLEPPAASDPSPASRHSQSAGAWFVGRLLMSGAAPAIRSYQISRGLHT